ncbi:MAG: ComF family protein [Patescibacteria group bacterium]|nr:ComF family protein [Patescibacteria group bacterium]
MKKFFYWLRKTIPEILFPKKCLNCNKEGSYLCEDCFSLIEISENQFCPFCYPPKIVANGRTCPSCQKTKKLNGLYSATIYQDRLVKRLINRFKYSPYVKELAEVLSLLIITHIQLLNKTPNDFKNFLLIPIPLNKRKIRKRGFNQSMLLAREMSKFLKIDILDNVLIKTRQTQDQVGLDNAERNKNVKNAFDCQNKEAVKGKNIILIDDVFTTGATMEESANTLKKAGAKEVWAMVIARG